MSNNSNKCRGLSQQIKNSPDPVCPQLIVAGAFTNPAQAVKRLVGKGGHGYAAPGHNPAQALSFVPSYSGLQEARAGLLNRSFGRKDITSDELPLLVGLYEDWVKKPTFLAFYDPISYEFVFRRAAKRGNSVYKRRINERIDYVLAQLEESNIRNLCVRPHKGGQGFVSNVFFITLTWDINKFPNRIDSWSFDLSDEYNKFITNLRKDDRFGRCWVWRVYESTQKGYPHVHLLVVSENPQPVFSFKKEYRLCSKSVVSDCWHSHVDVKAAYNIESVSAYLSKDLRKQINLDGTQGVMTAAMCWLFKKRSYSISSNYDLIEVCISQTSPLMEQFEEAQEEGLLFIGVVNIRFSKGHPPDEYRLPLSVDIIRDLNNFISVPSKLFENMLFAWTGEIRGYDI